MKRLKMENKTYIFKDKNYSIKEIIPLILNDETHTVLDGTKVKISGLRLNTFTKGTTCVSCGKEGIVFKIAATKVATIKDWHLTLWSKDGVQMTKDHIIPKSKGGKNSLGNMQCMCSKCNVKKGNTVSEEDFKKGEAK